ncbi:MAG TPA: hypothetical protein PKH07_17065 [bacterium]|nr:hypothetical protein [bacterium]
MKVFGVSRRFLVILGLCAVLYIASGVLYYCMKAYIHPDVRLLLKVRGLSVGETPMEEIATLLPESRQRRVEVSFIDGTALWLVSSRRITSQLAERIAQARGSSSSIVEYMDLSYDLALISFDPKRVLNGYAFLGDTAGVFSEIEAESCPTNIEYSLKDIEMLLPKSDYHRTEVTFPDGTLLWIVCSPKQANRILHRVENLRGKATSPLDYTSLSNDAVLIAFDGEGSFIGGLQNEFTYGIFEQKVDERRP